MTLTPKEIKQTFDRLSAQMRRQQVLCDRVDSWLRPELEAGFELPRKATREHRALQELSRTPWLLLVVGNVVQAMYVNGVQGERGRSDEAWRLWMANDLSARQIANHRAMIAYGHSYGVVTRPALGEKPPRIRFVSPRRMVVEYDDMGAEPYPAVALEKLADVGRDTRYLLRVPGREYWLRQGQEVPGSELGGLRIEAEREVDLPFVPVVRFANQLDLEGRTVGDVEPFIPTAQRINKTAYDRLLAQHFNSWKVKTATGIDLPKVPDEYGDIEEYSPVDQEAKEQLGIKLSQEDILMSENADAKFGALDATALDPFVSSWRSDIEALAAVSQTPAYALTGQLVNLSAEALAAARAPLAQKVYERQTSAGTSYVRLLRIAARMAGMDTLAEDDMLRATWQDMEIRSMSQAADALGKMRQMLNIPERALWGRIPGVEPADVAEWERIADEEAEKDVERDPMTAVARRHGLASAEGVSGGEDS